MDVDKMITQNQRTQQYTMNMRPVLNKDALFSDDSANYLEPYEPEYGERVTIKFRTYMDNVDYVFFISKSSRIPMKKAYTEGVFDYYTYTTEPLHGPIHYFFEVLIADFVFRHIAGTFYITKVTTQITFPRQHDCALLNFAFGRHYDTPSTSQ